MTTEEALEFLTIHEKIEGLFLPDYVSKESTYTPNRNTELELLASKILARHDIKLVNHVKEDNQFCGYTDKKSNTITITPLEKWSYCEFYFARFFISISKIRRRKIGVYRSWDENPENIVDTITAFKLLRYLGHGNGLLWFRLGQHFRTCRHTVFYKEPVLYLEKLNKLVDEQLNLVINHKGVYPLNFQHVSFEHFEQVFCFENHSMIDTDDEPTHATIDEYYDEQDDNDMLYLLCDRH